MQSDRTTTFVSYQALSVQFESASTEWLLTINHTNNTGSKTFMRCFRPESDEMTADLELIVLTSDVTLYHKPYV